MVYQNSFSSIYRAVHEAEAKNNGFTGEVKPAKWAPKHKQQYIYEVILTKSNKP
jgi:hypothetical protein